MRTEIEPHDSSQVGQSLGRESRVERLQSDHVVQCSWDRESEKKLWCAVQGSEQLESTICRHQGKSCEGTQKFVPSTMKSRGLEPGTDDQGYREHCMPCAEEGKRSQAA